MADRLTVEELDELERLHRESKRGAWYRTCTGELPLTHGAAMAFEDACLITGALNALPRLIAAAREAERLREVLREWFEADTEWGLAALSAATDVELVAPDRRLVAARSAAHAALAGREGE